jgi:hypothetical protein
MGLSFFSVRSWGIELGLGNLPSTSKIPATQVMKNSSKLRQLLQLRPKRGRRKEKIIGQIWFSEQKNVNEEMVGLRVIGE